MDQETRPEHPEHLWRNPRRSISRWRRAALTTAPRRCRASGVEAGTLETFEQLDEFVVTLGTSVGQS